MISIMTDVSQGMNNLKPKSFSECMAGILTIVLVAFVCSGLIMGKEISGELLGFTGMAIGFWFKSHNGSST